MINSLNDAEHLITSMISLIIRQQIIVTKRNKSIIYFILGVRGYKGKGMENKLAFKKKNEYQDI